MVATTKANGRVTRKKVAKKKATKRTKSRLDDPLEPEPEVLITPPRIATATWEIVGTSPYVSNKQGVDSFEKMRKTLAADGTAGKKKDKSAQDFTRMCEQALRRSKAGWCGISASGFRKSLIAACRTHPDITMAMAKQVVFICADGFDVDDGMPIVRIYGDWHQHECTGNNNGGSTGIRSRPMWMEWSAKLRTRWDLDQFSQEDIGNLIQRAGWSVGVGAGRPASEKGGGCGWGTYELKS